MCTLCTCKCKHNVCKLHLHVHYVHVNVNTMFADLIYTLYRAVKRSVNIIYGHC